MDRRLKRLAAATPSAALAVVLATTLSANAGDDVNITDLATPDMLAAAERDLGLSEAAAVEVFANDYDAMQAQEELIESLGNAMGGAWINDDGTLVVGITDAGQAGEVRQAGALPRVVAHSQDELTSTVTTLDDSTTPDASDVHGWYVDVTTNSVVVQAARGGVTDAHTWLANSGVDRSMVRVEMSGKAPRPLYDLNGGEAYSAGGAGCSIGFPVQPRGFVTAGHCGTVGTSTTGYNGVSQGVFQRSVFPGSDGAYVSANTSWTPRAQVSRYDGTYAPVNGSQVAPIGATTCRSGRTSGYRCGQIQAYDQTVNYQEGPVHGLTRTNACAAPGDSGGSFIAAGINAQGVTSGGSGFCGSGGTPQTFFQPVNPLLNSWGLTLVTQ